MDFNFWKQLNFPINILAPMEDVTDTVFREIILRASNAEKLHVVFTEFVSVDSICASATKKVFMGRLDVSETERELLKKNNIKIVAQIWGSDPEKFNTAVKILSEQYNFDGVDINMGCPVKKVVKNKSCSALILDPERAIDIINASMDATHLPVSVKTRIGFNAVETISWTGKLLSTPLAALTIHGRTQKMQSEGLADWNEIKKVVELRNSLKHSAKIIGNGDVLSLNDANSRCEQFNVDGVMIGRGIFRNPWLFANTEFTDLETRCNFLRHHIVLYDSIWQQTKNFNVLKRFFKIYMAGFEGAAHIRAKLMESRNPVEALDIINKFETENAVGKTQQMHGILI